jgi:excisionase family DNA binding protein
MPDTPARFETEARYMLLSTVERRKRPRATSDEQAMSSPEEVAARNRVSRTYIYNEMRIGRLIGVKCGRNTRIRREDEEAWRAALPVRQPRTLQESAA